MNSTLTVKTLLIASTLTALGTFNTVFADPKTKNKEHAFFDFVQGVTPHYLIDVALRKGEALNGPVTVVFERSGESKPLFELSLKKSEGSELRFLRRCPKQTISPGHYSLSFYQGALTTKGGKTASHPQRNFRGTLGRRFHFSVRGPLKTRVLAYYQESFSSSHSVKPSIFVVGHGLGFPFQSKIDLRYRYGQEGQFSQWQRTSVNEKEEIESKISLNMSEMTADYVQLECSLNLADQSPRIQDWFARNKGFDKTKRQSLDFITVILPIKKLGPFRSSLFRVRMGVHWNSRLSFSGIKNGFPQGTRLDIRFAREGNRQHIAYYRAINNAEGSFHGMSTVFKKQLPPGLYKVHVWIHMRTQTRALQRWFILNKGWTRSHSEVLESLSLRIGNSRESRTFIEKTRTILLSRTQTLRKLMLALEALYQQTVPGTMEENDKRQAVIQRALLSIQKQHYQWSRQYLALPLEKERLELNSILTREIKLLKVCLNPEKDLSKLIEDTKNRLDILIEKLK